MHDAAALHVLSAFQEILENVFPEQWIGQVDQHSGPLVSLI